jgi:hypothetical protein
MAKKKFEDFEFGNGEEYFPLDDDFDSLDGFGGDIEEKGVKGFFRNAAKSVKNMGVDLTSKYLSNAADLGTQVSMAKMEVSSKLSDLKEKAIEKRSQLKEKGSKGIDPKSIAKDVKTGLKDKIGDIKKGNFYKGSNSDISFDMDDDFGGGDDEYTGDSSEGTAKQNKNSIKYRPKKIINVKTGMSKQDMADISATQINAAAKVQYGIYKRQTLLGEQHFSSQMAVFNNIADNLYTITKMMSKEGMANFASGLEYRAKALAFMEDQTALLKEMRGLSLKSLGIKDKEEEEAPEYKHATEKIFGGGGFDLTEFGKNVGNNLKNMFDMSLFLPSQVLYQAS